MSVTKPHYEFGVASLEDLKANYPDVVERIGKKVFFRKLGKKYFRLGLYLEQLGEIDRAKEAYRKALLYRKSRPRYYWKYFRLGGSQRTRRAAPSSSANNTD